MVFLCLNCGKLNVHETPMCHCEVCGEPNGGEQYAHILRYARQSVHYGYDYRLTYEEQVSERGKVYQTYTLVQPSDIWDVIGVAILTGITYDMLKYITKQVVDLIRSSSKSPNSDYDKLLSIITDSNKLKQFVDYVQQYHVGSMNTQQPVIDAINEEKLADLLGNKVEAKIADSLAEGEELNPQKMRMFSSQAVREILSEGLESHYASPSQQQLDSLLQSLKRRTKQGNPESLGE